VVIAFAMVPVLVRIGNKGPETDVSAKTVG
jgi:hypothetical protein